MQLSRLISSLLGLAALIGAHPTAADDGIAQALAAEEAAAIKTKEAKAVAAAAGSQPFTIKANSILDGRLKDREVVASNGQLRIGLPTTASCPESTTDCPPGNVTSFICPNCQVMSPLPGPIGDKLSLNVQVEGGQVVYYPNTDPVPGILQFTPPGQPDMIEYEKRVSAQSSTRAPLFWFRGAKDAPSKELSLYPRGKLVACPPGDTGSNDIWSVDISLDGIKRDPSCSEIALTASIGGIEGATAISMTRIARS